MASIYSGRGGRSHSIYSGAGHGGSSHLGPPTGHPHHGGGFLSHLGPVGNLIGDVKDTVIGIGVAPYYLATHPVRTIKAAGQSMADYYGPLFHGDISRFARNVYDHPLNLILDAATIATLGGASEVRIAKLLGEAGMVAKEGRLARLAEPGRITLRSPGRIASEEMRAAAGPRPSGMLDLPLEGAAITRRTSPNPVIRKLRQEPIAKLLGRLPYDLSLLGEQARFWRMARRDPHASAEVLRQLAAPYMDAYGKLNKNERAALGLLARVPLPEHLDAWKGLLAKEAEQGNGEAAGLLKTIEDPKIAELYANPSKHMLKAHDEAAKLGEHSAQTLERLGVLTHDDAEAARFRHSRIAAGADVYTPQSARAEAKRVGRMIGVLEKHQAEIEKQINTLREKGTPESRAARDVASKTAAIASRASRKRGSAAAAVERWDKQRQKLPWGGVSQHDEKLAAIEAKRPRIEEAAVAVRRPVELEMLRQARADIVARINAGRAELPRLEQAAADLEARTAEIHPGIVGGPSVDEIRAQLQTAGRPEPIYIPDVPANTERAGGRGGTFTYGSPVHRSEGLLFATGRLALDPDVLGPNFLRTVQFSLYRDLHDVLLDSSVRVPQNYKLRPGEMFVRRPVGVDELPDLAKLLEDPQDIAGSAIAERGLTSDKSADALLDHGHRFVVPEKLARQVQAEFGRSSRALKWFLDKPTAVWRALVLNLRVGWLTNNIVGNHLLYALKHSGPAGLRAYLNAVRTSKGARAVRELVNDKAVVDALHDEDIRELIKDQASGTFVGSQAPPTALSRRARKLGLGLSKANQASEGMLRRAATEAELRRAPEVKARMKAMPRETRSFRQAARAELEHNPELAREVSGKVNDALGDFLSLSPGERRYIRAVFPFYAWYRAVSIIAFKLPLDYPGRADLLAKLSQVGLEESNAQLGPLPSFLEGAIPLGGDRLLKTQGLNPFATINQLGRAAAVPFAPGATSNELAGIMNPLVQALGSGLFGRERTKHGLAADLIQGIVTDLPQTGLAHTVLAGPKNSKLYQPSAIDDLLAFLGAPTKTIHRQRAGELAAQGK